MQTHYAPPEPLLVAREQCRYVPSVVAPALNADDSPEQRIQQLRACLAPYGMSIHPVLQSYMSLSTGIWCGKTVHDDDFSNALELGIIVPVATINQKVQALFIQGNH